MNCVKCDGKLKVARFCTKTFLYCEKCGASYRLEELKDRIDEEVEAELAMVLYDRL